MQALDDLVTERTGHVTDSHTDDLVIGVGRNIIVDLLGNCGKKVRFTDIQIVRIDLKHTLSSLNQFAVKYKGSGTGHFNA